MNKKLWKLIVLVLLALILTIGTATATVLAEEEDFPLIYSIVVPFTMR